MVSRLIPIAAAVLCLAGSARLSRKSGADGAKFIAGVPVLNYDRIVAKEMMRSGRKSVEWSKWVMVLNSWASTETIIKFCDMQGKGVCTSKGNPSKGGFAYIAVQLPEKFMEVAVMTLKAFGSDIVKFIEPDDDVSIVPSLASQPSKSWGLDTVGVPTSSGKGVGVNVYVLDTGLRTSHTDFGGRAFPALDIAKYGGGQMCNASDSTCARDNQGHGTHCAGTVGGTTFGVAPRARLFGGKVLGDDGSGSWSWSYDALDLVATEGKRPAVASMSLGGAGTQEGMRVAVDTAVDAGVVVVVAGGNDNSDACGFSPAFIPSAITVGSTTSVNARSSFSNFGGCTDIWAPGSDITSAKHTDDVSSATFSGTSMACPHVSGAAALVFESDNNLSPADVLDSLLDKSYKGVITGLFSIDIRNNLLWVGDGDAPELPLAPPPVEKFLCPSWAANSEPDRDGDCRCPGSSKTCSVDGASVPNCPCSGGPGAFGGRYFFPNCTDCVCSSR